MIRVYDKIFCIDTLKTSYHFRISQAGHPVHLHYGDKLPISNTTQAQATAQALDRHSPFVLGNTITYSQNKADYALESLLLEHSSLGKGDVREPSLVVKSDLGSATNDFVYMGHELIEGALALDDLPTAHDHGKSVQSLHMTYVDAYTGAHLHVTYTAFYDTDVITKQVSLVNKGQGPISLEKVMSNHLDMHMDQAFKITTFTGAWAKEMQKHDHILSAGTYTGGSLAGVSSNRCNPFFMVAHPTTTETQGACYGFSLVYSGNHYYSCQVGTYKTLRIQQGIQPQTFKQVLGPGETFHAPQAVLTYSSQGYNQLSHHMHDFINHHIVRGQWQGRVRPVLVNSWEAHYFDVNEAKVIKLAKKTKDIGAELFVLDDGWFGQRNNDTQALGDWSPHAKKFPKGIGPLAKAVNDLGLDFGIWVEPEMVNENSDLYKNHPEWVIQVPHHNQSLGRNQMILDLCNPQVQAYIIEAMSTLLSSANITYVKWDMNRIFTDDYSPYLQVSHQGHMNHVYTLGLYKVFKTLVTRFPHVLFESCASGGNRFDLGILAYMPQIWASDNTDAHARVAMQRAYSYGYPLSCLGAHVSDCPNHQTLRSTPLSTRYHVAAFGLLGYELNLGNLPSSDLKSLADQIKHYKHHRKVLQYGRLYRQDQAPGDQTTTLQVVSPDQESSLCLYYQGLQPSNDTYQRLKCLGLKPTTYYQVNHPQVDHNIKAFGDLINTASPVHIKKDSLVHQAIAKVYKLKEAPFERLATGALLATTGLALPQAFAGVGLNETTRVFTDFSSRLYTLKALENED